MRFKKHLRYGVEIRWDGGTGGFVEAYRHRFRLDTPEEWGGLAEGPCPDELLAASIGGCLLTTLLHFARRMDVKPRDVEIEVSLNIVLQWAEGYMIRGVEVSFIVEADEEDLELLKRCAEWAVRYCHITRSLEGAIPLNVRLEVRGVSNFFPGNPN